MTACVVPQFTVRVTYPTPNRVSLDQTHFVIQEYLATKSGGDRIEAVCAALFQTIGERFGLFDEVKRQRVNAPDLKIGEGSSFGASYMVR